MASTAENGSFQPISRRIPENRTRACSASAVSCSHLPRISGASMPSMRTAVRTVCPGQMRASTVIAVKDGHDARFDRAADDVHLGEGAGGRQNGAGEKQGAVPA